MFFANKMYAGRTKWRPLAPQMVLTESGARCAPCACRRRDRPQAVSAVECVQVLELDKITDKPWHIAQSNALTGEGLDEGIQWLATQMSRLARK